MMHRYLKYAHKPYFHDLVAMFKAPIARPIGGDPRCSFTWNVMVNKPTPRTDVEMAETFAKNAQSALRELLLEAKERDRPKPTPIYKAFPKPERKQQFQVAELKNREAVNVAEPVKDAEPAKVANPKNTEAVVDVAEFVKAEEPVKGADPGFRMTVKIKFEDLQACRQRTPELASVDENESLCAFVHDHEWYHRTIYLALAYEADERFGARDTWSTEADARSGPRDTWSSW
jgi:hypothetical protein